MKNTLEKERKLVRDLINFGDYNAAINECNNRLNYLNVNGIEDNYNNWFFNLRLAISYRKLGEYKKALEHTHISMEYVKEQDEYFESIWFMGNCFYSMGNKAKAIKFYERCKDYYQRTNNIDDFLYMSFNIAKLTNNERLLKAVIELYKMNNIAQTSLDNAYACLCNLYINKGQYKNAENILINIADIHSVQELRNRMTDVQTSSIL